MQDVNFRIKEGDNILLKGKSGVGKTTVVNLIFGYIEPDKGIIKISGKKIEDYSLKSIRENIGYMSQEVMLFSGSLKENMTFGREVEDEVLKTAIKNSRLEDMIERLPNGLETESGEMGFTLSGGERKRIGLVRLFLKNPKIIILDEPFAGVDINSRILVKQVIDKLFSDRTRIVISHDENEDDYQKVIILEDGNYSVREGLI